MAAFELSERSAGARPRDRRARTTTPRSATGRCSGSSTKTASRTTSRSRDDPAWEKTLVTIAAFDVLANNADRKSGHVLLAEGRLWAIDNGLSFHPEPKLRTVIWDYAGERIDDELLADVRRLVEAPLPAALAAHLGAAEREALVQRAAALCAAGHLPVPDDDRDWPPYPWPLV